MTQRILLITCIILALCMPVRAAEPLPAGSSFEIGFSPNGNAEMIVLQSIRRAKASIRVAAYSFTSKPVAVALRDAHKRGIAVHIVADAKSNTSKYSAVTFLANQGLPVRTNGNYAILHHKFMVIDGRHVQTGSFNYSGAAADKNAENVLILYNVPKLADQYNREWSRLWDEGTTIKPGY